jgi:uncharacterized membrane protein (UPF0127 family)
MAKTYTFTNETKQSKLAERALMARSFFKRLKGLLGTKSLESGAGLLIAPCNSIHMFGMSYAIDAIFLDKNLTVVATLENIKPGQMSKLYRNAHSCLELPVGVIATSGTMIGDQLSYNGN